MKTTKADRTFKFTQQRIRDLPSAPQGKRVEYYDTEQPRLVCRVTDNGVKSFAVIKWVGNSAMRVTLGRYTDISVKQARDSAAEVLSRLAKGVNVNEEKRVKKLQSITLIELLNRYLVDHPNLREATIKDYKKNIRAFDDWQDKPINSITREMVMTKRTQFENGRDNKFRVLRLLFKYAYISLRAIQDNPVDVITDGRLWEKPKRKKRIIEEAQLKIWFDSVIGLENERAKVYLLMLLHTGLRDQDIRYLEWSDIDFINNKFTARDTKNHSDFTGVIAPQLRPYLRNLQSITGNDKFIFSGNNIDGVMDIPRKPIAQITKQTGIAFSSHDLKRTYLTIGEALSIPASLLKVLANHKTDSDVTYGYISTEWHTKENAMLKIADFIQNKTASTNDNVVTLRRINDKQPG